MPNALYHVRLVATNSRGTSTGSELTFTTRKDGAPPAPVLGKSEDVSPVSGIVFFVKNGKLVPLTEGRRLPNGTEIDAFHGSLKLMTSAGKKGKTYTGTFGGAVFRVTQDRSALSNAHAGRGQVRGAVIRQLQGQGRTRPARSRRTQ